MSTIEALKTEIRESRGSSSAKKLRAAGKIPAVIYGHGLESISISVVANEVDALVRGGSKVVDLKGGLNESAFLKEIQWDAFGNEILHVDFTRVSKGETIQTTVSVDLRGDAPGTKTGGILQHVLHSVEIDCPMDQIPDKLEANINSLELGQSILVSDLDIPDGVSLLVDPASIVVQVVEATEEEEETVPMDTVEPEVIGRKADEEEETE